MRFVQKKKKTRSWQEKIITPCIYVSLHFYSGIHLPFLYVSALRDHNRLWYNPITQWLLARTCDWKRESFTHLPLWSRRYPTPNWPTPRTPFHPTHHPPHNRYLSRYILFSLMAEYKCPRIPLAHLYHRKIDMNCKILFISRQ